MEQNEARPHVYFIPHNFVETGTLFNGLVRIRNFFEGMILALLPVPILIQIPNLAFTDRITLFVTCCGALGLFGFLGIDGESLTQYLFNFLRFRRRRTTARYNPRVKLEAVPDYLENKDGMLPKDRILKFINSIRNKSLGESDEYGGISSDLFDKETSFFFEDDVGILDTPDELKTKAELKAEKRKKKVKEPKRKKSAATGKTTYKAKNAPEPKAAEPVKPVRPTVSPPAPGPIQVDLCISTQDEEARVPNLVYAAEPEPSYIALEISLDEIAPEPTSDKNPTHIIAKHEAPFVTIHGLSKNLITVSNVVTRGDTYKIQTES